MFSSSRDTQSVNGSVLKMENTSGRTDNEAGGTNATEEGGKKGGSLSKSSSKSSQIGPGRASEKWLLANHDSDANIYTITSGISLADLYQDGDYRLLIGDIGFNGSPKLKV